MRIGELPSDASYIAIPRKYVGCDPHINTPILCYTKLTVLLLTPVCRKVIFLL